MRSKRIKSHIYKGVGTSTGVAFGRSKLIHNIYFRFKQRVTKNTIEEEKEKLNSIIKSIIDEFKEISSSLELNSDQNAEIFEANILILEDPVLLDSIRRSIENGFSAEYSINLEFDKQISNILSIGDTYLRERAEDLTHLKKLILNRILNISNVRLREGDIIVAQTISANDIYYYNQNGVKGIISVDGGLTSHASILARAFNIPYIVGIKDAFNMGEGTEIIVDASNGEVHVSPSDEIIRKFRKIQRDYSKRQKELEPIIQAESITIDGRKIDLSINIDFPEEVDSLKHCGAKNVGLVRTENLIKSTELVNEEKQFQIYSELAQKVYPGNLTFRFFDIGSDKIPTGFINKESNPALGVRGIRFLLNNKSIFKSQIRALLKASTLKNLKLMIPMVTNLSDLKRSLSIINKIKKELTLNDIEFDKNIEIGIMIETPSSVFQINELSKHSDFFSIGTNDLIQYLFASDRTNENVTEYYNNFDPVLLRVINEIVIKAKENKKRISICGEIAYDKRFAKLFALMGVDELSLSSSHLTEVKEEIINFDSKEKEKVLEKILNSKDPKQVQKSISKYLLTDK